MSLSRRDVLKSGVAAAAVGIGGQCMIGQGYALEKSATALRGKADHVISIWLGGGPSQVDTFDPKRVSKDGLKDPGSAYPAIDTAIPGVQVCEHLKNTAPLMDRCMPVRTVHHDVIDEHAAAAYRMHTGRATSGTIIYPCLGALISKLAEPLNDLVPSYVLMGNPSPAREPGFLGAQHGYIYLTETKTGPKGLTRPERITDERFKRRIQMLEKMREQYVDRHQGEKVIDNYLAAMDQGFRLSGPEFMSTFNLAAEPSELRVAYGDEFGQRCLLARRLIERGSRFVEVSQNLNFVNGTGWDTHNDGHKKQHLLIQSLDKAFATLIQDLEEKNLLDKTIIMISGEFGRPSKFDGGGGRGHQGKAFSVMLAGGGLKTGQAIGTTNELCTEIADRPVSVPDLFATVLAGLGLDPTEELYSGARPVPVTDGGVPIAELFA